MVGSLATGEWLIIRWCTEIVDSRFGNHWINSPDTRFRIRRLVNGIHLYPKDVARLKIPLPPLDIQMRIAGILDAADALRVKRREALAELDTLLQSTFLDMFGDPVTNPKGWEVKPLSQLLGEKSRNGAYYPKNAYSSVGTRMVHMANAFYGVVNPNEVRRVDASRADIRSIWPPAYGSLVVSRRCPLSTKGQRNPCLHTVETDERIDIRVFADSRAARSGESSNDLPLFTIS